MKLCESVLVLSLLIASAAAVNPTFKWAQDNQLVFVTFETPSRFVADTIKVDSDGNMLNFYAMSESNVEYSVAIPMISDVEAVEKFTLNHRKNGVFTTLRKAEEGWWEHFLEKPKSDLKTFLSVDWSRWVDEDEVNPEEESPISDDGVDETNVVILTDENFDSFIADNSLAMVEFYAPWCGHCKTLKPEYADAADELVGTAPLGKMDATEYPDIAARYGVTGYPTIKIFLKGEPRDYTAGRTTDDIVDTMKALGKPAVIKIETLEELEEFQNNLNGEETHIVGFFQKYPSPESDIFETVATDYVMNEPLFKFAYCNDPTIARNYGVDLPSIPHYLMLFKPHDEELSHHSGDITLAKVEEFVEAYGRPLVEEADADVYERYKVREVPVLFLFLQGTQDEEQNVPHVDLLRTVARDFRGRVGFASADANVMGDRREEMGMEGGTFPHILIEKIWEKRLYPMTQEGDDITVDLIRNFLNNFLEGNLLPHLKSEPIPEDNTGPVVTVVGKTFDQIVLEKGKDVLLEFYAPWCGHCKKLEPIYTKLAMKGEDIPSLTVAKIDGTQNDYPPLFDVQGFPTIYFIPAFDKENPIKYEGARTVKALKTFVKQQSHKKVSFKKLTAEDYAARGLVVEADE